MSLNILIVDDMQCNRISVKGILEIALPECNFFEAKNGKMALEIIEKERISVMILDIVMPEIDGIGVLTKIKASSDYKELQVIICSSLDQIDMVKKALELGALDYFKKPLTKEDMSITLPLKVRNALEFYKQKCKLIEYYEKTKEDLKLAENVQKALITEYSKFVSAQMWGAYYPYDEIGGDMFSFKECDNKIWFMIADVSGHGISSAMISSMVNIIFNTAISQCKSTKDLLNKLNSTLNEVFKGSKGISVSVFIGCIENKKLYYANAGHPYPVLIKKCENRAMDLSACGFLLGVMDEPIYEEEMIDLNSNDILILYTDGLYDKGEKNQYSKWGMVRAYCNLRKKSILGNEKKFVNDLVEYFRRRGETNFVDDVAVMLIKII